MILWMNDPLSTDETVVGGKMANLAVLAQRGIPVPHGFTVTHDSYKQYLTGNKDHALRTIAEAYLKLKGRVAVRSSAIGEDGTDTSFAGQFETILGVEGVEDVLNAVIQCWDSVDNARSSIYRERNGIDALKMCLGIISLVPAASSGVAFSHHPVTGNESVLIEATHGWGEALVSGQVTPDMFEVNNADTNLAQIVDSEISDKRHMSMFDPIARRIVLRDTPDDLRKAPSLSSPKVHELGALVKSMESMAGYPIDVEWVLDTNNEFVIVQQRPITTL